MKNYKSKALTEAGLITALVVMLSLINSYVPVFSMLGNFLIPIPFAVLYLRQDKFMTFGSVFASAFLMAMLYNPIEGILASVIFGLTGITLGFCIKKNKSMFFTIASLAFVSIIGTLFRFVIYIILINKQSVASFVNELLKLFNSSINESIKFYTNMGVDTNTLEPIKEYLKLFTPELILSVIPAFIILSSIISGYLNYILSYSILKKLGYNMKNLVSFRNIYVNSKTGAIIGIFLLVGVILNRYNVPYSNYIVNSTGVIMKFVLMIDGLSLAVYYMVNKFHISKAFITFIIIFVAFSPISILLFYLGLMDIIFDFRKLDPNRNYNME
ncbi:hypothetical protein CLOACE_17570 [Clostridium acetireducens DSM 10703]|jgi:uncharacterized protein YybS (DUF2232 family)|uniref:DUF2232 domain-containing protein n=1 Tax=Clostridium acetireducens DSM 10703 TaxID=1121290 RepID=A0A1E8EXW2_9CLOT|nr:YybS family protein [Clostridium acetireducens]OFI05380.1 hypothetical protein CLOACE_17570 [Clostridium acetireducens DSM 10703]